MGFQNSNDENVPASPFRIRVPFLPAGQQIGAGDVLKRITAALGVRPCQACQDRAGALNRFLELYR